jgi:hypothetical protein
MSDLLRTLADQAGFGKAMLRSRFDAQRDTPELFEGVASGFPEIRQVMASLRHSLPVAPHSQTGWISGPFFRIPNHYRSVCCLIPAGEAGTAGGAIVFKGTEPLIPDFPEYLDWMLRAPFRTSYLPLGLHFPLEMKLPPGAMWLEECLLEQKISTKVQSEYFARYARIARLPVPLFVYELTSEHRHEYRELVRARISSAAFSRIEAKVAGGLGVEVYYYPNLPIRAADLFVSEIKASCASALTPQALEDTFSGWIRLLAEMLHLGYMPYAPWNSGMGACVDAGNACIDGGFNDLLTITPFDSIPGELLFWRSLAASIQMLAGSIASVCSVAMGVIPVAQLEPPLAFVAFVNERLREHVRAEAGSSHPVDARLRRFFETQSVEDVCRHLTETARDAGATQFRSEPVQSKSSAQSTSPTNAVGSTLLNA